MTLPRFERRSPAGKLDRAFRRAFGSYGVAAHHYGVCLRTLWRWRQAKPLPPDEVLKDLGKRLQQLAEEVSVDKTDVKYLRGLPRPQRPLSGACAHYVRKPAKRW